jgi:ADP-ribosylglycohydrolase
MSDLKDKILGSWLGMAVGDALGQSVKGLKPETVKQYFKQVDRYHDVRPYIGKGIKQYRMAGLYGVQTQRALAVCDSLLKTKKPDGEDLSDLLVRLSAHGPENYFGMFRRPEGCFYKSVQDLPNRSEPLQADQASAYACYFSMAVPLALYQQRPSKTLMQYCIDAALLLSRHPWEVVGSAVTGFITVRLLNEEGLPEGAALLKEAAEFCQVAEAWYRENYPDRCTLTEKNPEAMSRTLNDLADQYSQGPLENLPAWICDNASSYIKTKIVHATQGHALTILPLALVRLLTPGQDFASALTGTLNQGREADKLGALVGCWAGAVHGLAGIPQAWQSGLVNGKEIKLRGEALAKRKKGVVGKDLLDMELGLTQKEAEERRKYMPKEPTKSAKKGSVLEDLWLEEEAEDGLPQLKEDPRRWREFERDKTRKKRDRRRLLPGEGDG